MQLTQKRVERLLRVGLHTRWTTAPNVTFTDVLLAGRADMLDYLLVELADRAEQVGKKTVHYFCCLYWLSSRILRTACAVLR